MTAITSTPSGPTLKADFTLHALDLNATIVSQADAQISAEDLALLDTEINGHWIFNDPDYAPRLQDLVQSVRAVHSVAGVIDDRNDRQLAARVLQSQGLWVLTAPVGVWGRARFMVRFMAAYGKLIFRSDVLMARVRPPEKSYGAPQ